MTHTPRSHKINIKRLYNAAINLGMSVDDARFYSDKAAGSDYDHLREVNRELVAALESLLTYDRVERPAFRAKPEGAPHSSVRIRQDKLIALEDRAAAVLAKAKETAP